MLKLVLTFIVLFSCIAAHSETSTGTYASLQRVEYNPLGQLIGGPGMIKAQLENLGHTDVECSITNYDTSFFKKINRTEKFLTECTYTVKAD